MNRKFFQLRQMTRNLDETFKEDLELYVKLLQKKYQPNPQRLNNDKQMLQQWDQFKQFRLSSIIDSTLDSDIFKICICDFIKKKRVSMEFWIKVAYDIFHDEAKGKQVRMKFWRSMRKKSSSLELDLKNKKWPVAWRYLEREPCLNLELLKLYEQYMPIRPFFAQTLNTMTNITCDLRRMPMLKEEKSIEFDLSKTTWFPKIDMCGPAILEQLSSSDNYFCDSLVKFTTEMKAIMFPILDFFRLDKKKGRIINLFGEQHDFILEVIYSLKAFCGQSINYTQGSLKKKKNYKCTNSYKINEMQCSIMLTTLSENDLNQEVINDIQNNIQGGYSAFIQDNQMYYHSEKNQRLVLIFSQKRLQFGRITKGIKYYQIPDQQISTLKNKLDYEFLIYYANILFNKCMIVQQNCSSRKPFYQVMICMWTYVLAVYLSGEIPNLEGANVFQGNDKEDSLQDIQIDLGLSSYEQTQEEPEFEQYQFQQVNFEFTNQVGGVSLDPSEEEDCMIVDQMQKKKKIILV
ncbi:unnamed protein product [Paramecium pentaurelia]|uniref:Uncharacterized protein n=1 Tax=Paramecium pentaurelia TaxID=43138 RepID=A0A8S1TY78_9CILI|nr:unnamed protein product [Paramecium pentaurelia]